jgi:D-serine deaminase-like pyridoxal phosphate-dependent protein
VVTAAAPAARSVHELATPVALIDAGVVRSNLERMRAIAAGASVSLWPHVKTHKSTVIARQQQEMGAGGFTVATLREAEVMAGAGFTDLLIAYPPIGESRIGRLAALMENANVTLLLDSLDAAGWAAGLGQRLGRGVRCRWEIDCGARRCGTPPGADTVRLASDAFARPRLEFAGFLTFPGHAYGAQDVAGVDAALADEADALMQTAVPARQAGFPDGGASGGTTPTCLRMGDTSPLAEARPGNYVFNDATQVALGVAEAADCALTVLTTVVAKPAASRLILDAGSKAVGKEVMSPATKGLAWVSGRPLLIVSRMYEEHSIIDADIDAIADVRVGDRVELIPNHACAATNLQSFCVVRDGDDVLDVIRLDARNWHARA